MKRPKYEKKVDFVHEVKIIEMVKKETGLEAYKLPFQYRADFCLCDEKIIRAFAEIKWRECKFEDHHAYIISMSKMMAGAMLQGMSGVLFCVIFRFADAIKIITLKDVESIAYAWGGRKDRGDWQDMEPVLYIPRYAFRDFNKDIFSQPGELGTFVRCSVETWNELQRMKAKHAKT